MLKLGILMDPIGSINIKKDSSFAMLLAAQRRGWPLFYMEQQDLVLRDGEAFAHLRTLQVKNDPNGWFELGEPELTALGELDVLLMRKDPPVDMEFMATTYFLDRVQAAGTLVVNHPASLRDVSEKLFTAWFPQCCPPTLVARDRRQFLDFIDEQGDIIVKPLFGMGGASIFHIKAGDNNTNVILETLTRHGQQFAMAQRFIPEISAGDKRILLVNGQPVPYALARIPAQGEARGNLAAGGRGEGVPLSDRDRWICEQVAPVLLDKGIYFAGLDVIGDYLTEINVTSPTCIRELDKLYDLDIAGDLMDALASHIAS